MNKNVEQAVQILAQVVDAATAAGIFKKAAEAGVVAQALQIIVDEVSDPIESEPELKAVKSKK